MIPFEAPDRSVAEDLSPVWRMLALSGTADATTASEPTPPVVRALPDPDRAWRSVLADGLEEIRESGATLIVPLERPVSRAILSLLARKKAKRVKTPSPRKIHDELASLGARIEGVYVLWPSARTPRIAYPRGETRLVTWAQRSGVLGGGGNRLWARALARSPLFTPFAILMFPGLAFVVRGGPGPDA